MYIQPHVRGIGAGRALVERLLRDATELGYTKVRLESLRALAPAHTLYRSVGFMEVEPYTDNSMKAEVIPGILLLEEAYTGGALSSWSYRSETL